MFRRTFFQAIASLAACCGLRVTSKPKPVLVEFSWSSAYSYSHADSAPCSIIHCELLDQIGNRIVLHNVTKMQVLDFIGSAVQTHTPMIDVLHQLGQIDRGCHI